MRGAALRRTAAVAAVFVVLCSADADARSARGLVASLVSSSAVDADGVVDLTAASEGAEAPSVAVAEPTSALAPAPSDDGQYLEQEDYSFFEYNAFAALWSPATMESAPEWSPLSTKAAEKFFGATTAEIEAAKQQYDEIALSTTGENPDDWVFGTLAQTWAYTAAPGDSINVAAYVNATDAEATTFMYLNCLKQQYSGKGTSKSLTTFIGMLAMSPLRKYASFEGAVLFAPTDQAFLELVSDIQPDTGIPLGGPILSNIILPQVSAMVAMHLVPDSSLQGTVETGPRLAMDGSYPGVMNYDRDGMSSTKDPWPVNSTLDFGNTYNVGNIIATESKCSYSNGPTLYIIDKVLACNVTGSMCPFETSFGGTERKPSVNVNEWSLPANFLFPR